MKQLVLLTWVCASIGLSAGAQTIENDLYVVRRAEDGSLSIATKSPNQVFLSELRLTGREGVTRMLPVNHRRFGAGQAMEILDTDGLGALIMLFPTVPFVLIDPISNTAGVRTAVPIFSGLVAGRELKTFGTGGLLDPAKNPGSYAWQAVVDPASRKGAVFGWITQERGSGVFFTRPAEHGVRIEGRLDYGVIELAPKLALETLAIGYFDDARYGLEAWADAVARQYDIHLKPQPVGYCTWYSKPHGGACDEKHLAELSEFAAKELAPFGFSVVQIDDKWQAGVSTNGPKRDFTRHAPEGPYPSGMKAAAEKVRALGLTPGIWFMPFAGTYYDPVFKDRQNWFVKRKDGQPYETAWGGTCLDMTRAETRDYVRSVASRISQEWGFGYVKIDGLWTGSATRQQYVNSGYQDDQIGDAVFSNPSKSNIEAYREGLKTLREAVGSDVFILGCNGPQNMRSYGGAFGLVDGMRIGPDNGTSWKDLMQGPIFGSRHYFLHDRIWHNDPDPVYVRESIPLNQARLICSWVTISGQLNLSSEWLPGLPAERLDILKRTMPSHGLKPRPADLFENDPPRWWLLTDDRSHSRRDVIAVFNWSGQETEMEYSLKRLGLDPGKDYIGFDFWENASLTPIHNSIRVRVPAESCRVISLRPVQEAPQVVSTSRHITQGIVDLRDEEWDGKDTLSGRSALVGKDPYELRIATVRAPSAAELSKDDLDAGATISVAAIGGGVARVRIESPANREVRWKVRF